MHVTNSSQIVNYLKPIERHILMPDRMCVRHVARVFECKVLYMFMPVHICPLKLKISIHVISALNVLALNLILWLIKEFIQVRIHFLKKICNNLKMMCYFCLKNTRIFPKFKNVSRGYFGPKIEMFHNTLPFFIVTTKR